jgi:hypothetical protein
LSTTTCHRQRYEDFETPGQQLGMTAADVPQFPLHVLGPMFWLLFSIHSVIDGGEPPKNAVQQHCKSINEKLHIHLLLLRIPQTAAVLCLQTANP